jgi:hypothetical protein
VRASPARNEPWRFSFGAFLFYLGPAGLTARLLLDVIQILHESLRLRVMVSVITGHPLLMIINPLTHERRNISGVVIGNCRLRRGMSGALL